MYTFLCVRLWLILTTFLFEDREDSESKYQLCVGEQSHHRHRKLQVTRRYSDHLYRTCGHTLTLDRHVVGMRALPQGNSYVVVVAFGTASVARVATATAFSHAEVCGDWAVGSLLSCCHHSECD